MIVMARKTKGDVVFDVVVYTLAITVGLLCLYPILHILFASFSDPSRLMAYHGVMLKPLGFTLNGYRLVFKDDRILLGYRNTAVYVGLGTLINMVITIMGAYTLSRRNLYWKKPIMVLITITMFFGGGLIPWFLVVKDLGMFDNLAAMLLPTALNTWNMILMRTAFEGVPKELEEAAEIDGASEYYVLMKIILPLSKAVLAVIFLYYFVGNWNSWFNAMILMPEREKWPLQLYLQEILVQNDSSMSTVGTGGSVVISSVQGTTAYRELVKYCSIVVSTLPVMCIYPFLQKYFVKGVYVGSLKG